MPSKTLLPELIVGTLALFFFKLCGFALFGINNTVTSEWFRSLYDTNSLEFINVQVSSAIGVFVAGTFLLIGIYCYGVVIEYLVLCGIKLVREVNKRKRRDTL